MAASRRSWRVPQANPSGHYETQSDPDHVTRIVAYRKLADYPFIVTAAQATDEALGDYYEQRRTYLMIRAAATAVIILFFSVVTVLAVRLQRHRAELKSQRLFLETLVDNIPSGITVRSMRPGKLRPVRVVQRVEQVDLRHRAERIARQDGRRGRAG